MPSNPCIYFPYIIGGSSPIPYLFEKISTHLVDEYNITIHSSDGCYFKEEGIEEVRTDNLTIHKKAFSMALASIRRHDLVHTGARGIYHYLASRGVKIRNSSAAHIHTFRVDVDPERWNSRMRRRIGKLADVTTAVSEHTAATVEAAFDLSPKIVYNGVDTDLFSPEKSQPELFKQFKNRIFIFVGRFEQRKRPRHVLEIAKRTEDVSFVMAGDGPQFKQIKKAADELSNLHLLGNVEKSRLPSIYAHSTALLFPTVQEGCPNVVLEAMASGTPVLGYQATSMPELVDDGDTGYLVKKDDIAGLQSVVARLDESTAEQMGLSAMSYVRDNHQFNDIARDYRDIYRQVL